jgi:ABC-type polar amino acid transport system ATPase subunit
VIVVKDLKKNYNGLDVLKGIDLTINKGDVVCLVGPSGCGKSTFLRCLTRLEEPDGGTVMLDGKEITERDIDATRAQMGMVFQHFNLFPHLTVKKNITLAPVRLGRMSQAAADRPWSCWSALAWPIRRMFTPTCFPAVRNSALPLCVHWP